MCDKVQRAARRCELGCQLRVRVTCGCAHRGKRHDRPAAFSPTGNPMLEFTDAVSLRAFGDVLSGGLTRL